MYLKWLEKGDKHFYGELSADITWFLEGSREEYYRAGANHQWAWWKSATNLRNPAWLAYKLSLDDTSSQATFLASLPARKGKASISSASAW